MQSVLSGLTGWLPRYIKSTFTKTSDEYHTLMVTQNVEVYTMTFSGVVRLLGLA